MRLIEVNPDIKQKITSEYPHITAGMLNSLERVGLHVMHPRLLLEQGGAFNRVRNLPLSEQKKSLDKPIQVVLENGEVIEKPVHNIRGKEIDLVFAPDHIRSVDEQRQAIIQANARKKDRSGPKAFYEIIGGRVHFTNVHINWSPDELRKMADEAEAALQARQFA